MGQLPDLQDARRRLGLALSAVRHDRLTLGFSLATLVAALRGPMSRLTESEAQVAHLLSHGLSTDEIAHAIHTSRGHARALSENVAKKFESVSADRLMFPAIQLKRMTW